MSAQSSWESEWLPSRSYRSQSAPCKIPRANDSADDPTKFRLFPQAPLRTFGPPTPRSPPYSSDKPKRTMSLPALCCGRQCAVWEPDGTVPFNPFLHYHSQALPDRIACNIKSFPLAGLTIFAAKQGDLHLDDLILAEEALGSEVVLMRAWEDPRPKHHWVTLNDLYHCDVAMCRGPFAVD